MTKSTEIVVIEEHPKEQAPKINFFSLFPNIKFDLQLPFFNPKPKDKPLVADAASVIDQKKQEQEAPKPNVVWFPKTQVAVPPPLEAEAEAQGSTNKTSNPVILWQVYALGAFFISRWIWARWNERKAQGKSPNDGEGAEGRHSDDVRRSSDNE